MSSPVVTEGGAMPAGTPVTVKFTELGLSEPLLRAVAETALSRAGRDVGMRCMGSRPGMTSALNCWRL